MTLTLFIDYVAVAIFAVTGALAASRAQLDIIGFIFLSCLTAVGGGTVRDLLLKRDAVFWIEEPNMILLAALVASILFFSSYLFESRLKALMWADALALGTAVAAGTGVAISMSQPAIIVVLMGVATGCLGGLMRDVVCNEVPLVLKQGELYVSAAFAGAAIMLFMSYFDLPEIFGYFSCILSTFILRGGSMVFGWKLPTYKARGPKNKR